MTRYKRTTNVNASANASPTGTSFKNGKHDRPSSSREALRKSKNLQIQLGVEYVDDKILRHMLIDATASEAFSSCLAVLPQHSSSKALERMRIQIAVDERRKEVDIHKSSEIKYQYGTFGNTKKSKKPKTLFGKGRYVTHGKIPRGRNGKILLCYECGG